MSKKPYRERGILDPHYIFLVPKKGFIASIARFIFDNHIHWWPFDRVWLHDMGREGVTYAEFQEMTKLEG